jgi:hypothetical protein
MYEDTLLIVCAKCYENLRLQVGDVSLSIKVNEKIISESLVAKFSQNKL